jgi:hypothetical protein
LKVIVRFAAHIIGGVIIFGLITLAVLALHLLTHWVETQGISPYIVAALQTVEFVLFAVDVVCLFVFIFKEARTFILSL